MRTGCIGRGLRETRRIHDSRWQGIPVREIIRARAAQGRDGPDSGGGRRRPGPRAVHTPARPRVAVAGEEVVSPSPQTANSQRTAD